MSHLKKKGNMVVLLRSFRHPTFRRDKDRPRRRIPERRGIVNKLLCCKRNKTWFIPTYPTWRARDCFSPYVQDKPGLDSNILKWFDVYSSVQLLPWSPRWYQWKKWGACGELRRVSNPDMCTTPKSLEADLFRFIFHSKPLITFDLLMEASSFVQSVNNRDGIFLDQVK